MQATLLVAVGSALGGMARYGIAVGVTRLWDGEFPWATLLINIVGSFVIGWYGAFSLRGIVPAHPELRTFVMVGLCGGFTTFSSFSLQTVMLARQGDMTGAVLNIAASVGICLLAVILGQWFAGVSGTT